MSWLSLQVLHEIIRRIMAEREAKPAASAAQHQRAASHLRLA